MRERAARLLERLLDLLGIATVFELLPRDVATCNMQEVCYSGFRTLVQPVSLEESLVRGFVIVALAPVSVAVFCGSLVRGLFCRLGIYVDFYRHWVERRPPLQ